MLLCLPFHSIVNSDSESESVAKKVQELSTKGMVDSSW